MNKSVRAYDLSAVLDGAPDSLKILSLDCFDTLLWRNVQRPTDVFADLPITGGGVRFRGIAEETARKEQHYHKGVAEVPLEQIYRKLYPFATETEIAANVEAEIEAEARHCYAFAPTVRLIEAAKARGLKVIVVSDTYFSEPQLRSLIARAAGDDVEAAIDQVFCSSEYGMAKGEGLFTPILKALTAAPATILHVGDNKRADQDAPEKLGINTVHLEQFDTDAADRFRLEAAASTIIDAAVRETVPAYQPHRAQVALRRDSKPSAILGHDIVGPVMHAFASWVKEEAGALQAETGKAPRILFLLRDGHLPLKVFQALFGDIGSAVEISRFTSAAASFVDEAAVRAYFCRNADLLNVDVLGKQLLLTDVEIKRMSRQFGLAQREAFERAALKPDMIATICKRSRAFGDRLIAHLKHEADVEEGDVLMLVDLGYAGTVQNMIEPVLRERLKATVAGRYLLLREEDQPGFDKKGMIDHRHYDLRAVNALCGPISILEQLCTIEQGSVIDYEEDGTPIRKASGLKSAQSAVRADVQEACLAFAREAECAWTRAPQSYGADCQRRAAAAILARLLFLPSPLEIEVFSAFDHDINMGTEVKVKLLDVEEAGFALRRRGLSYLNDALRMYLPGELQPHGLPLNLALFSSVRFGLDIRSSDFEVGGVKVPLLIADATSQAVVETEAFPTHHGYYHMRVPVGASRFSIGLQIGQLCEWVQIDEIAFYPVKAYGQILPGAMPESISAKPIHDGMEKSADDLFKCNPEAILFVPPPAVGGDEPLVLSITFRPIVWNRQAALRQAA